ncbi:MAG: murein biosynthesis integral membrane protein MurJ [Candidatus Zixiibacteriota bacterium]|nr:MAG: murein biosynthesis integral membrane protein MurJ [candidate division Zixibacteria bacterium]
MSTDKVKKSSIASSAAVVSGATAFSRVLGLVREQAMAYFFGASLATDAFVTAFRIPNLLRDMFAEGALSSAFVPVFKEKLVKGSEREAFSLANITATAVLLFVGGIVLLGILAAPAIIYISANGFTEDPHKFDLTVRLTRLMFVYLLLVSLSSLVMGMLNSFGRFGIPALAPAMFNIGTVLSIWLLHRYFTIPIYSMAIGVLIGGVGQLVIQVPALLSLGYRFRFQFDLLNQGFKKILRLFTPMVIGLSAGRINIIVNTLVASFLVEGSLTYLNYSYRLMHFPLGVFAVALGTVALPKVSELAARGDLEEIGRSFREALNLNLLLVMPSAAFLSLFGSDLVRLVYQWGAFTDSDATNTGLALLHYSYGLIGFAAVRVTVPVFYALGDARLPTRVSIISVFVNMALYYPMVKLLGFAGLAAATSAAGLLNFGMLLYYLPGKNVPVSLHKLLLSLVRIAVAAWFGFYLARMLPIDFSIQTEVLRRLADLAAAGAAGGLIYLSFCIILRVKEISGLKRWLLRGR